VLNICAKPSALPLSHDERVNFSRDARQEWLRARDEFSYSPRPDVHNPRAELFRKNPTSTATPR
jgi:hypothetical protein